MEASNSNQDLSKEDLALKEKLESYVNQLLQEPHNPKLAVESLKQEMVASYNISDSLTDVLKLLKFLRPHYNVLKDYYHEKIKDPGLKKLLADVLSVLAMMNESEKRGTLKYRLLGSQDDFTVWGFGYVKKLVIQVMEEYKKCFQKDDAESSEDDDKVTCKEDDEENTEKHENDLLSLAERIVAFYMKNKMEIEAVDLVTEFERLDNMTLLKYVDQTSYKKTCLYINSLARFIQCEHDGSLLGIANAIYLNFKEYANALRIALFMEDCSYVKQVFEYCDDLLQKKQLCYMVARHGVHFRLDRNMVNDEQERKELQDIINNLKLSRGYLDLARDLEVMEPKSPEDVYKGRNCGTRRSLADVFVNAFVNAGFGKDNLIIGKEYWVSKNIKNRKMCEAASLGVIMLWDIDKGLKELKRWLLYDDTLVKSGALLGVGILNSSIKHDSNPVLKHLLDYVDKKDECYSVRIGAIMGLGLSYANSKNKQVANKLMATIKDNGTDICLVAFAAISLGLVYKGVPNERVAEAIIYALRVRTKYLNAFIDKNPISSSALPENWMPFMRLTCLGLSLLFLGEKKRVSQVTYILQGLNKNIRKYCEFSLISCAYVGSGDVLTVQSLLANCDEEAAVLGIAMVAMADELGLEMAIRSLEHLLRYGEPNIRKTVPLALSLLCISNPKRGNVVDVLSSLTRDPNSEVAMSAIISLGLVGSGTNNARIYGLLQNLSRFYSRNDDALFCVQIAVVYCI